MAVTRAFTTSQLDSRVDFYYTATSGQTTFSGSDDNGSTLSYTASGKKDVYLNGTLLIESDDYVATNGTSVVLQATTQAGDIVHISVNKVMSNLVNLVDTSVDLNGNELILDADGDTSITADTDDQIDIKTGGSDRVTINSSGNVGIGTSSPAGLLSLETNNPNIRFDDSDTSNNGEITLDNTALRIEVDEDNAVASSKITFRVDGSDKAVINSSGNLDIQGQYSGKGNSPYFVARIGTTHTATDNAYTKAQFDTIVSESTSSGFDNTNHKFVVPSGQDGIYQIEVHLNIQSNTSTTMQNCYIRLYKNGSATYPLVVNDFTGNYIRKFSPSFSRIIDLSAGDEIEIYGFSNISGTLEFTNQSLWSMFKLIT